ncbi:class I SAM-dependent methyltransferase [Nostoc sp. C117]|uniref:class I SAM-dependent methyltransferase n=1 Tax=Nostoc sp. C117 TaxID=3349875 RepID=UPI00370D842F
MNQSDNKKFYQKDFALLSAPLMAAYRAIEIKKNVRLFYDPFTAKLATFEAETFALEDQEENGRAYLVVHIRIFDDFLISSAHIAPQVVSLAAGMNTCAFRLNCTL